MRPKLVSLVARSSQPTLLRPHRTSIYGQLRLGTPRTVSKDTIAIQLRTFKTSAPRQDVFFASFPAIKSGLLSLTRISLIALPFVFRYK